MYPPDTLIRENLREAHSASWQRIAEPGSFWRGSERISMVTEARAALACSLCDERKAALSPHAANGDHQNATDLDPVMIDAIHRMRTDPGRLTKSWFDAVIAGGVSQQAYVEMVSVVNSSVIIDTLHCALGLDLPELPTAVEGEPSGDYNLDAVDDGAWLPVLAAEQVVKAETRMPTAPYIGRAMGLVPSAVALFFQTFRPHYALVDIPLALSQAQAEFIAARTSALNECFY